MVEKGEIRCYNLKIHLGLSGRGSVKCGIRTLQELKKENLEV